MNTLKVEDKVRIEEMEKIPEEDNDNNSDRSDISHKDIEEEK